MVQNLKPNPRTGFERPYQIQEAYHAHQLPNHQTLSRQKLTSNTRNRPRVVSLKYLLQQRRHDRQLNNASHGSSHERAADAKTQCRRQDGFTHVRCVLELPGWSIIRDNYWLFAWVK